MKHDEDRDEDSILCPPQTTMPQAVIYTVQRLPGMYLRMLGLAMLVALGIPGLFFLLLVALVMIGHHNGVIK
jgi:hypothetical protein